MRGSNLLSVRTRRPLLQVIGETPRRETGTGSRTETRREPGTVFVKIKFEIEADGKCTFTETSVEGSVDVEILDSAKELIEFGLNEPEEVVGFMKVLPNGTKECKIKAGNLDKCTTSSLKAFGVASTLEGLAEVFLAGVNTGEKFGVFS